MEAVEEPRFLLPTPHWHRSSSPTPVRTPAVQALSPSTSSKYRHGNKQCKKQKMNYRVILDPNNTKIKIKSAPSHPFNLNFMYLYHLGGVKKKKAFKFSIMSQLCQPLAPGDSTPAPTISSCFLISPLVFVSHRKMFLPFRHNQRGKCPSLSLSSGEKGGLGNRGRSKAAWLTVPLGNGPKSQGFLLRL